ncbi:MAG TPA: hypothetical protein VGL54_06075 [Solirubrobacteraceae bacterium]|jgi:hypothetical protein
MSSDPSAQADAPSGGDPQQGQAGQPNEEQMRAAYEAELSRITSADMILQSAVSLLNLGGRRLGLAPGSEGERDLGQVRDAVDGVRALLEILERSTPAQELRPLRDALSQLQMAYARSAQEGGADTSATAQQSGAGQGAQPQAGEGGAPVAEGGPSPAPAADRPGAPPAEGKPGAGPAESSGRLWVPGR